MSVPGLLLVAFIGIAARALWLLADPGRAENRRLLILAALALGVLTAWAVAP